MRDRWNRRRGEHPKIRKRTIKKMTPNGEKQLRGSGAERGTEQIIESLKVLSKHHIS